MTAKLLCHSCEQRLSVNGEAWALTHCWRGKTFSLRSILTAATPEEATTEVSIYWTSKIAAVNRSALTYFAASMFWRASIHNWWIEGSDSPIDLGPYSELLRRYLMGIADFPETCALVVVVDSTDTDATKSVQFIPAARRFAGCHMYVLHFLGIQFQLFAGKMFPEQYREMDFVHGKGSPILVTSRYERWKLLDLQRGLGRKRLAEIARRMK
jgi:hypothetical protein